MSCIHFFNFTFDTIAALRIISYAKLVTNKNKFIRFINASSR